MTKIRNITRKVRRQIQTDLSGQTDGDAWRIVVHRPKGSSGLCRETLWTDTIDNDSQMDIPGCPAGWIANGIQTSTSQHEGQQEDCHTAVRSCLVLVFCLVNFLFYFENLTSLSFQVTCPSSCVPGLTSSLITDCFHLFPSPSCVK